MPLLLLGISAVSFALLNLAPGDPSEIVLRQRNPGQLPSPAEVAVMRAELGLDTSLAVLVGAAAPCVRFCFLL